MPALPMIGKTVTVTVKNDNRMYLVCRPETTDHTGTIVPSFPWLDKDEFCMTTGLANYPVRTIRLGTVLKVVSATGQEMKLPVAEPTQSKVEQWNATGSKGDTYIVTRAGNKWSCTCVAGEHGKACKHVAAVKAKIG